MTRDDFIQAIREKPQDEALRFVASDWFEENNEPETANRLRHGPIVPVIEETLESLQSSYDWEEVFGEGTGGNCGNKTDPCPPGSDVDCTPPSLKDVVKIIAAKVDHGDFAETTCVGVFVLKDGRYLLASGSCDTTGWD